MSFTAMTDKDWERCKVLNQKNHQWGDWKLIAKELILELDRFSHETKTRVVVVCGTQGKHVDKSYHFPTTYRPGIAVDVMCPGLPRKELPDLLYEIFRYKFMGVGLYSEWSLNRYQAPIGGLHLDMRPTNKRALWLKGKAPGYEALTAENILKWFK